MQICPIFSNSNEPDIAELSLMGSAHKWSIIDLYCKDLIWHLRYQFKHGICTWKSIYSLVDANFETVDSRASHWWLNKSIISFPDSASWSQRTWCNSPLWEGDCIVMARAKMDMLLCQAIADFQTRFFSQEKWRTLCELISRVIVMWCQWKIANTR